MPDCYIVATDSSWLAAWRASAPGVCSKRRLMASAEAATCLPNGVVGTYDVVLAGVKKELPNPDF